MDKYTAKLIRKIKPDKSYNLWEIYQGGFFYWLKSYGGVRNLVRRDYETDNCLKAITFPTGDRKNSWRVRGDMIQQYLNDISNR